MALSGRLDWSNEEKDKAILAAHELAVWLLGDTQRAQMAVNRAVYMLPITFMKAMETSARTDRNRRGKTKKQRANYVAHLDREHISTRVLMNQIEAEEIDQEKVFALDEKGRVRRSAKHVFTLSVNQNSFWAAIGVCRVVCNYTAAQALLLYSAVAPHRACRKDEPACSGVRETILGRIAQRFGVAAENVMNDDDSPPLPTLDLRISLIRDCFAKLIPSTSTIIVPEGYRYQPTQSLVPFSENDPDADDKFELDRMCLFFNIANFNRIAGGVNLKPFEESVRKLHIWDASGKVASKGAS